MTHTSATLADFLPQVIDTYAITVRSVTRPVAVIVTQWGNCFSVYAESDITEKSHTEVFDPLFEDIDHLPTRAEIIEAFEEAHLARCESNAEGRLCP